MSAGVAILGVAVVLTGAPDDSSLGLADLAAYRAALEPATGPAVAVGFRDLWERPGAYRGRRVRVEGRVERRFRQERVGTFPALTEVWIVNPSGDPFCLVFPTPRPADEPAPGATAAFTGTFLKVVRYQAGDAARLAPLIVGDRPPTIPQGRPPEPGRGPGFTRLDWGIGIAATAVVIAVLVRQSLGRPLRGRDRDRDRDRDRPGPPEFWSPGADESSASTATEGPGAENHAPSGS
ncbi:MAG TPA: hypothetical protein VF590_19655 [Isosphaeraceae bacterium]|jgi:hypothetical protein